MSDRPRLLGPDGQPIRRQVLTQEIAGATVTGVRSPITGYPTRGMTPERLATILYEADQGDGIRYFELAQEIEEKDAHYIGVLGTRRRSVTQLDITVEPGSEDAVDVEIADRIRDWLARDELTQELFDILDCIGKGVSFTEIVWDFSAGQYTPARLEWRDPRWFRWHRRNLTTPLMLDEQSREQPLPWGKFVQARIAAKSGLPLRSGIARIAAWAWLFKAYTQRDWAVFTATYMQPLRLGKWGAGASEADKETLFRAVANIAGDCAAIIPESMAIEFVKADAAGTSAVYMERANWLDQQVSKAVLGQTATTDAIAGGHAVGREHRLVQEDIERADARALAAILTRDLIVPWVQLEWGPRPRYPRLILARPEADDLTALAGQLAQLVPLGLKVSAQSIRDKFGLEEPADEADTLGHRPAQPDEPRFKDRSAEIKASEPPSGGSGSGDSGQGEEGLQAASQSRVADPPSPAAAMADRMEDDARPAMAALMARLEAMTGAAGSMEELREMLLAGFDRGDALALAAAMTPGLVAAQGAGRVLADQESDDGE